MLDTDARAKLRSLLPQVLARRLNEAGAELGTTAYCLHVYLLQKLYLVPLGYRFKLYPEGPQCDEVLGDLDLAKSRNEVQFYSAPVAQHSSAIDRISRRRKEHPATVAGVTTQLVEATQPSSPLLDRGSGGDEKSIAAAYFQPGRDCSASRYGNRLEKRTHPYLSGE